MESYVEFRMPQTLVYGRGSLERVGNEAALRGNKVLIVSDGVMDKLGIVARCQEYLDKVKVPYASYLKVNTEPTDLHVAEALKLFVQENCNVIVGLGGGSCIDTAKAVSVTATNGGYIGEYMGGKKRIAIPPVAVIAIPTTAGTGSEVTNVTIITDTQNDIKMMIKDPALMPAVAIVDPVLSSSSPDNVTAATGMDALCHAIEAYISRRSQPLSDTLALSSIQIIMNNIREAYNHGNNLDAREYMSLAAMQAGAAFSNASVCLVHGMSRPIGAVFHVPHGVSNAMLLPAVLEFSKESAMDRLENIGRLVLPNLAAAKQEEVVEALVREIKKLCQDINIPNLKTWGIDKTEFKAALPKLATDAIASGSPNNNPRIPSQAEMLELYEICYEFDFSK